MALEDYGWADRMVHKLAFGSTMPQQVLLDMERKRYGKAIAEQPVTAPIFITAPARAGTTILLEILSRHPAVVTHTHRDMPFILSPIVWRGMTRRFQVRQDKKERSHGDGIMVDVDSPEAFEEVLWLRGQANHYHPEGIKPWERLPDAFAERLRDHMRALIVSRAGKPDPTRRYVSKNNANIARLDALAETFPDALFVVPLRAPIDHARSLLKQHRAAIASHGAHEFARDYAAQIGHFEFGKVHRPILFPGMHAAARAHATTTIDYWLHYWICAYRFLEGQHHARFLDMARFTAGKPVAALLAHLGLSPDADTVAQGEMLLRPMSEYGDDMGASPALLEEAGALFERLRNSPACLL
ncbi:sulfotransferase [Sphingomicrobium nitratireducens]|uniref:sulfotransferase n=1 Tax=Sphingomicrobium nitratireducens TaxID=2964666 RepID=UPI00223EF7E1|nr:sulfotransferase [Sphingomicrobium nitratireducens]